MTVLDKGLEEPALSERESVLVRSAQRCIMAALDHSRAGKIALLLIKILQYSSYPQRYCVLLLKP